MSSSLDPGSPLRVLYVAGGPSDDSTEPMDGLAALDPNLHVDTVTGAAAALVELRSRGGYRAIFLSPQLAPNEALALIATLRRDRTPVAIVAIIHDDQRAFFSQAITAGADDVLVLHAFGLEMPKEALRRIRTSRHVAPMPGQARLRVLYVGEDDLAFDLLADLPFAVADRTVADPDGTVSLGVGETGARADVVVVDEQPGDGHLLRVVKWLQAHEPDIPIVVMTSPTGHDLGGAALELGATDVVSKSGTYSRRLAASLARRAKTTTGTTRTTGTTGTAGTAEVTAGGSFGTRGGPAGTRRTLKDDERAEPDAREPEVPSEHDVSDVEEYDEAPDSPPPPEAPPPPDPRIAELAAELETRSAQIEAQRVRYDELAESLAFERAMRNRDREEMASLRQSLNEEHERRVVLEDTLRHTEDRAVSDAAQTDARHANVLEGLERHVSRLQDDLTTRTTERDRLIQHELFGWATVTEDGVLIACNAAFAKMFGFDDPADAIADSAAGLAGLVDHAFLVEQLRRGKKVERVQSVLHRSDGQPFRVLTSAAFLESREGERPLVERMLIDLEDRSRLSEQLRLARRLESAGRLAAEMSPELDAVLPSLENPDGSPAERRRAAQLLRQLLAFSRHQAKPAGLLSLTDAVRRALPLLRQIGGDLAPVTLDLEDAGPIAASEDDVEQLLSALAFATVACLPYGGTLTFRTRTVRDGFDQRTELSVTASGYGVHSVSVSTSLTRLVTKCGGTVQSSDDPARATTLHVFLPC